MHRGVFYGLAAYGLWGVLPIYWKLLQSVPASEILAHRVVWSLAFCGLVVALLQGLAWIPKLRHDKPALYALALASVLLTFNWGLYIWAVNQDRIVETSLGYFINPLVSVALGVIVLRERIGRVQWTAIALAVVGVGFLVVTQDQVPWIALCLACSFGVYGLLKKQASIPALQGLTVETAFMFPVALGFLIYLGSKGELAFAGDPLVSIELVGAGLITAVPLLFFAAAAKRVPLSLLGLLQYLAPTVQFCIGVFVYDEPFPISRLIGFGFIWLGLLLVGLQALRKA